MSCCIGRKSGNVSTGNMQNIMPASNVMPGDLSEAELAAAADATQARMEGGFDEAGKPGGSFTRKEPPPGKIWGGYKKGATGVNWVNKRSELRLSRMSLDMDEHDVLLQVGVDSGSSWPSIRWHPLRVPLRATIWELYQDTTTLCQEEQPQGRTHVLSVFRGPSDAPAKPGDEASLFSCPKPTAEQCSAPLDTVKKDGHRLADGDLVVITMA